MSIINKIFKNNLFGLSKEQIEKSLGTIPNRNYKREGEYSKKHIFKNRLYRYTSNIKEWRDALDLAEDEYYPDRRELYRIYQNAIDDYQICTSMNTRTNRVLLSRFVLKNDDGSINEEATKRVQEYWFFRFVGIVMDSLYYGYELANLIVDKDKNIIVKKIKEQNTAPEFSAIKINAEGTVDSNNLIYFKDTELENSLIEIYEEKTDLGLINKAVPYYIWKQIFGSWSQHADVFGVDTRIIKTDLDDSERVKNAQQMLEEMRSASWAIFDPEDIFENVGQKHSDAFNIYEKLIDKCDAAISKIFLGQVGTTDEKSYVGSANVHLKILDDYTEKDKEYSKYIINSKLLPFLVDHDVIEDGLIGDWDDSKELSLIERKDIIKDLAQYFNFKKEFIENWLGIEIDNIKSEENAIPQNNLSHATREAAKLYQNILQNSEYTITDYKNPFKTEHAARLQDPKLLKQKRVRRTKGNKSIFVQGVNIPSTIEVIWYIIEKDNKEISVAQSLRFPIDIWTEKKALKWLENNEIDFILFEPAENE